MSDYFSSNSDSVISYTEGECTAGATKAAVTAFVKKGSEIEQERDADTRENTVYARKVMLVALTDATKIVKITEATV